MTSTWILLRGLSRSARHWGNLPQRLEQALPDSRVLAIDLPGNGRLNHQPSATDVATMAEQARSLVVQAGVVMPCHLVALSLGGMVASAWAARWPQELRSLVLINTSLRGLSPFHRRMRPAAWPTLLRIALAPCSDRQWEESIHALTSQHPERRAATVADWMALRQQQRVTRLNVLRQLLAAARFRAPDQVPAVATLLLASRQDQLVDWHCSAAIALRWQTRLTLHPSAGHDLPLDDPDWLVEQLTRWHTTVDAATAVASGSSRTGTSIGVDVPT